ncbi:MAG: alpha/beta hydrolase fold domain-containing protein [Isosphaeraceae bacterium]
MKRLPGIGGRGVAIALLAIAALACEETARPPAFDVYPHKRVHRKEFGWGPRSYWLFEPADPIPEKAPVVVLNHGWLAVNPGAYGAWIDHLVRSGNIVIYPRYQCDAFTWPSDFLPNALAAVKDALDVLDTAPEHVRPDRSRFALIGHSAGGNLAAQMAAVAAETRLPAPRAVLALMPGEVQAIRRPSLDKIPGETLLVVTVAEDDRVVGDSRAREIFTQASAIPLARKKYILFRSDLHGVPRLVAHHLAPTACLSGFDSGDGLFRGYQMTRAEVNAFDRAGCWRIADVTLDAGFNGKTLDEATSNGELFRHLGYWSDGRPVERPVVGDDLSLIPRVLPTHGVRLFNWSTEGLLDAFGPGDLPPAPAVAETPEKTRR